MKFIGLFMIVTFLSITSFAQETVTQRDGEPDIYNTDSEDQEMNEAVKKSRATFADFTKAFDNKTEKQSFFSVKMPFATDHGSEHLWLSDLSKQEGKLVGKIDNLPAEVTSVKLGQTIEIDPAKISDWFYVDNGKLIGGYTIRVIRNRMSAKEKKQFDKQLDATID
jgi:uncharacterized protein YegJ (DUF2314 family)